MLKLCRIDIDRSKEVFEGIEKYKTELVTRLHPTGVILFGSFATGDFNEGSDIDLIVVADWNKSFLDRIKLLMEINSFGLPIEPIGYTEEEFSRLKEEGNPFIAEVLDNGKVIYERVGRNPVRMSEPLI